jgi:hypothetical protein
MAVTQRLLNMDAYFKSCSGDKIIINDLSFFNNEHLEKINHSLMTIYENSETLSTKPSCDCGATKGMFRIGKYCNQCGTQCLEPHTKVKPLLWLKTLTPEIKFLNPTVWLMISQILNKKRDLLRWLCDYRYNPPTKVPKHIIGIRDDVLNGERVYSNTMNHLEQILVYLLNHASYKTQPRQQILKDMLELIHNNPNALFSEYLPIINKKIFVVEEVRKGKFINLASADIVDVVKTWLKICSEDSVNEKIYNATLGSMLSNLAGLYKTYFDQYLVKKSGTFRKHVYGARSHFTFRCVIVSVPGKHKHDEISAPWCVGVTAFRPHILNKLTKRGYTYKSAILKLYRSIISFDTEIYEILNELIKESPYRGIPCIIQRNPSLKQGSANLVYITQFTDDPSNMTIKFSCLIAKAPNADYDGDELNVTILLDNYMCEQFKTLQPFFNVPDIAKPYEISGNLGLLSPSTSIIANYLYDKTPSTRKDQISSSFKYVDM